ncbi:MAG: IS200/IS605 family element transposase accessory protein TnpB [Okeania sp. SIO2C9]|uniref:RNA-guided endonuclease InsQ/TnpB family protein n=1 Tax=Okeania sp. SIO2C9 TaxID=2607791 RepID=UPI0013C0BE77|nr:transposase [Okeania sp. SIO2C9]NEQ74425.1 IS200/IS605 family element transposase accessory protein TnpB [Okeania sp. SIO2C9]
MYGFQQVLVGKNSELIAILKFLCEQSHKLTNMGIYYARQLYFKSKKTIGKFYLEKVYKNNNHYKVIHSQAAQQILRTLAESFRYYYGLIKAYTEGEITKIPRIPNYRKKGGMATFSYPKQGLKLKGNQIRVPLGKTCKRWFGLDCFYIYKPSNLEFNSLKELRILPINRCFYWEFVYEKEVTIPQLNQDNGLGIDHGLNNWLTCVSNVGNSLIVDGKHLKSMNSWYNKQISTIKENKPTELWSNRLAEITEKRSRQMLDGINKVIRIVINHCLENNIGTIVFGWNKRQKNEIKLGKKNNSEFVQIPIARLKERIAQLSQEYGIIFIETEESYTCRGEWPFAPTFLDGDYPPIYGEKLGAGARTQVPSKEAPTLRANDWKPSGRRTKRGLYRTGNNCFVNADCKVAANIIRKVSTKLGLDLS